MLEILEKYKLKVVMSFSLIYKHMFQYIYDHKYMFCFKQCKIYYNINLTIHGSW